MPNVLLLHGLFGNSRAKTKSLVDNGFNVYCPRLSNWSFKKAVSTANKAFLECSPDIVVGSSRGGAIAMTLEFNVPMILMSPAWKRFGVKCHISNKTIVIHGNKDTVIDIQDSITLCKCHNTEIRIVEDNHRLIGVGIKSLNQAIYDLLKIGELCQTL